jgi:alkanesulfonate monooxygenase SsuD/methylene tetrahydromethanopterin reductase-like flavin-dependent oxidoreductase (luciferase family)
MRFGFALPQVGSAAGPEALVMVAKRAEDLGVDSLWVLDRLLWPVNPRAPYPLGDGSLPVQYKNVLDPVETPTFAAAHTSRIALATGVLNLPWYNPVLLARRLTTLDILSRGRLRVGFGIGWSPDEYEAAGATWQDRRPIRRDGSWGQILELDSPAENGSRYDQTFDYLFLTGSLTVLGGPKRKKTSTTPLIRCEHNQTLC